MKVLAIDPGYGRCGMAVVEKDAQSRKEILLYSTCVETSSKDEFTERLATVAGACARLIVEYKPDWVALEKLFITKNQKTAMRVAEVRGALIETATRLGVGVSEYTPGQIKSAMGSGSADKVAIARMVHMLIKIEKKIEHDDEYDAIAIGVTHLAHIRG